MRMMTDARDLDTGEVRPEPLQPAKYDWNREEIAVMLNLVPTAPLQPAEDDWIDAQAAAKARLVSEAMDKVLAETEQLRREIATTPVHRPAQAQPAQAQPYELSAKLRIAMAIVCFFALIGVLATFAFFAQQIVNL